MVIDFYHILKRFSKAFGLKSQDEIDRLGSFG